MLSEMFILFVDGWSDGLRLIGICLRGLAVVFGWVKSCPLGGGEESKLEICEK